MTRLENFLKHLKATISTQAPESNVAAVIEQALQNAGLMTRSAPESATAESPHAKRPAPRSNGRMPRPARPRPEPAVHDEPFGGRTTTSTFVCEAGTRHYQLYVPAGGASVPRPLVVMLHGCTQNAADFARGTAMNRLADEHGFIVLYPEQDRSANPNLCWNWFQADQQGRASGEPAILAALTRQVMADHDIDPKRVFATGLSAGGAMAAILGATHPDLYAAIGVHSGLAAGSGRDLISGLHAMKRAEQGIAVPRRVPIIIFHGEADAVVHPDNGRAALDQFVQGDAHRLEQDSERIHSSGHDYTTTRWRDGQGRVWAEHWLVHGAGHAWQGGVATGSHTDPQGPSASQAMVTFFLRGH